MSEELQKKAEEIRDETRIGKVTAERVGNILIGIIEELDNLKEKQDDFLGFTYIDSVDFPAEGGTVRIGVKTTCKEWEVT